MRAVVETTWWLEWFATRTDQHWARLQVFSDGSAEVLDIDGHYQRFATREAAKLWLLEDEHSLAERVIEEEQLTGLTPPWAPTDTELIPLMLVRKRA